MEFQCNLCPRKCNATRGETGNGFCGMGSDPVLARAAPHFDEEPVISGVHGSGAVFFSGCCLRCRFCQNYEISTENFGKRVSPETLRKIYFRLIDQGVHNINLVNPTHFTRAILQSLEGGLPVPVVWNTGGYERVETLRALEGKVQIYLPDYKYRTPEYAERYSGAADYPQAAEAAIREMVRQTGPARFDGEGRMTRGTMVRHLVLPGCVDNSLSCVEWVAETFAPGTVPLSLMCQYTPMKTPFAELDFKTPAREYEKLIDYAEKLGVKRAYIQDGESSSAEFIPKFGKNSIILDF